MDGSELLACTKQAFHAFDKCFLTGFSFGTWPWETAELTELYEDYYDLTGDISQKYAIVGIVNKFLAGLGPDWQADNFYYDDTAWIVIAVLRAYRISGRGDYLDAARKNFDALWGRAWDSARGGAYFSKSGRCKTVCSNLPLSIGASMLGELTGQAGYFDKAAAALEFVLENLYEKDTGRVLDAVNYRLSDDVDEPEYPEPRTDVSRLTYNHGTLIGAASAVYKHTKDPAYLACAGRTAAYVKDDWFGGSVMDIECDNGDLVGFKGIFARYLGAFAREYGHPELTEWLVLNAKSAWSNRNRYSLMDTRLGSPTSDDMIAGTGGRTGAFNFSSALSVMIQACPRGERG